MRWNWRLEEPGGLKSALNAYAFNAQWIVIIALLKDIGIFVYVSGWWCIPAGSCWMWFCNNLTGFLLLSVFLG